jgi:integrase
MGLRAFRKMRRRARPVLWVTVPHLNLLLTLWDPLQIHLWTLLVLSFFTLVRPAEILNMRWRHVFFAQKYIWLPWSKTDPEGDGTYVSLLPPALQALDALYSSSRRPPGPDSFIFPITASSLASKCERLHLPTYTWYHLKHGGATYLALLGWPIPRIMLHGRWKVERSARGYIHAPVRA